MTVTIYEGDNLEVLAPYPDGSFTLAYLDPPFNTGRTRERAIETTRSIVTDEEDPAMEVAHLADETAVDGRPADEVDGETAEPVVRRGFHGRQYERIRGMLHTFDDRFDDYWEFLEPRLREAWRLLADDGTLYLHLDYREAHYAKVMLDAIFGRDSFLNEIIWAYDYGGKTRKRWPTKHETILVYVKNPDRYVFNSDDVDREPYMAPGLVTPEKAARGKLPTDVWWHTIVPTSGKEKTGYPTQKPEGILRRIVQASSREGDHVLDMFAGSGTTGVVADQLGRHAVLVDDNRTAAIVMRNRLPRARFVAPDDADHADYDPEATTA